jgi:hypothetical protein
MSAHRLERALGVLFERDDERAAARALLASYGEASHEGEHDRVRFAMLSLSGGSLDELAACVRLGKTDYRDVLMNAEYSELGRKQWLALCARVGDDAESG